MNIAVSALSGTAIATTDAANGIAAGRIATALDGRSAGATAPSGEDAELLALDNQADEIFARFYLLREPYGRLRAQGDRRIAPYLEDHTQGKITDDAMLARIRAIQREIKWGESDLAALETEVENLVGATDPIFRRVMELPANTPAGLAVKARCAAFACEHFWDQEFDDADWDHMNVRALIEAVLQFAGRGDQLPWQG